MKNNILICLAVLLFSSCTSNDSSTRTKTENVDTVSTITVQNPPPAPEKVRDSNTQPAPPTAVENIPTEKPGKHPISLQWLGWDKPGQANVTPAGDGWYNISGQQKKDDRNYLSINGKVRRLSEKELEFEGTVETRVETIYGGEPCIKKGKQRFFGKGTRTYFRLQNMENCEGGNLVDYVDIYPGTSSL